MGSKKRAKQKEEKGFDPTTTKEEFDPQSPEAIEAAEKFEKEQAAHMADMDDSTDETPPAKEPEQEPSEKPAETTEPPSQPQAKEQKKDEEAIAEDQPAPETPEPKADVPAKEQPAAKAEEQPPKEPEFISGERFDDYSVEVITDQGAKRVPVNNLVTTYQKYGQLQRKHLDAKPLFDLAEKAGVPLSQVYPLLEIGIQTYMKQQNIVDGKQPPVAATIPGQPTGQPGSYQGPFKDAEQDAYYKEVDPDMHETIHRMYQVAQNAAGGSEIAKLRQEIASLKESRTAAPQEPDRQKMYEEATKAFDGAILKWSGDHTDYFTASNIGQARLEGFKRFIMNNHANSGLKIKDLTPEFLQNEFARFDSNYNMQYLTKLAQKKAKAASSDAGMYAEGTGVRSKAEPLDEQQKHMADML